MFCGRQVQAVPYSLWMSWVGADLDAADTLISCNAPACCLLAPLQGERALGFVLGNQGMIDKTLMFDIDLIRIQK
jgi:hypothetical protein